LWSERRDSGRLRSGHPTHPHNLNNRQQHNGKNLEPQIRIHRKPTLIKKLRVSEPCDEKPSK
jgi:hypothetical protein